jgi:hypothetical protein
MAFSQKNLPTVMNDIPSVPNGFGIAYTFPHVFDLEILLCYKFLR